MRVRRTTIWLLDDYLLTVYSLAFGGIVDYVSLPIVILAM